MFTTSWLGPVFGAGLAGMLRNGSAAVTDVREIVGRDIRHAHTS